MKKKTRNLTVPVFLTLLLACAVVFPWVVAGVSNAANEEKSSTESQSAPGTLSDPKSTETQSLPGTLSEPESIEETVTETEVSGEESTVATSEDPEIEPNETADVLSEATGTETEIPEETHAEDSEITEESTDSKAVPPDEVVTSKENAAGEETTNQKETTTQSEISTVHKTVIPEEITAPESTAAPEEITVPEETAAPPDTEKQPETKLPETAPTDPTEYSENVLTEEPVPETTAFPYTVKDENYPYNNLPGELVTIPVIRDGNAIPDILVAPDGSLLKGEWRTGMKSAMFYLDLPDVPKGTEWESWNFASCDNVFVHGKFVSLGGGHAYFVSDEPYFREGNFMEAHTEYVTIPAGKWW